MTTAKTNKEQMVQFLDEHFNEVTDKNLQERITYTANAWKKDHDSVKLSDLRPLVKEVEALLPEEESKPAPAKKPVAKKSEKKSAVQKSEQKGTNFDLAGMFEETITTEIGTLTKAQDIKTFADLRKALENEEEIYFAIYWTERLLRQFDYVGTIETVKKPKNFPNDLDLVSCIYLSDEDKLAVGISSYTDMPYIIQPKDMTITEDGFRYTSNMEFELYRLTDAVE